MHSDNSNEHLAKVFFEGWESHQTTFTLSTSGSTGQPKPIELQRDKLIWSAKKTFEAYFSRSINKYQLCCIPVSKVGGFMQLVRSVVWETPIDVVEPSSNPLLEYRGRATIASFTPMQLVKILENPISVEVLNQFHTILIGGGQMSPEIEKKLIEMYPDTRWIHTFAMTETYSHFAGRFLGETVYKTLGETEVTVDERGALMVRNFLTDQEWMKTNDLIEMINETEFIWKGRTDFTLNSGGIKIQIETVEAEIMEQTGWQSTDFCCWYAADELLGQKLILICSKTNVPQNWKFSQSYFKPKDIYYLDQLVLTETGKVNRKLSYEMLNL